jgi:hypothetical protein
MCESESGRLVVLEEEGKRLGRGGNRMRMRRKYKRRGSEEED